MKHIRVFLALSVTEFKDMHMQLAAFADRLNSIYVDHGAYLDLVMSEHLSSAMNTVRKQDEYNILCRDSQYCYVLLGARFGEYTREEFDIARETSGLSIRVFLYGLPGDAAEEKRIEEFTAWAGAGTG